MKSLSCKHNRNLSDEFSNLGMSSLMTQVLSDPLQQTRQCRPMVLKPWFLYTCPQALL